MSRPRMGRPTKHSPRWLARKLLDTMSAHYPKMSHAALTHVTGIVLDTIEPYSTAGDRFFKKMREHLEKIGRY